MIDQSTAMHAPVKQRLSGKHVIVGVGGSIAAYRACDVVRRLRELGATVRVAMTKSSAQFVTPLTFEALSGARVLGAAAPCRGFGCAVGSPLEMDDGRIPHVEEAYRADGAVLVAATADLLAKVAHGIADEALTATLLSLRGPLIVAPAMESRMWDHPATQANVATLQFRNALFVGPVAGPLASGRAGSGRLAPVDDIVEWATFALADKDLQGRRIVITAGPTVEDIDPVRYLTNRSSGKMGVALARAAAMRGARVELVHGPMRAPIPTTPGVIAHPVRSAGQMLDMTLAVSAGADALLLCAAVADARPKNIAERKLKKTRDELNAIELEPTTDILATLGARRAELPAQIRPVLVGFAAETGDIARYAREKLTRKRCDLVVANDVSEEGSGFDVDTNRVLLVSRGDDRWLPQLPKDDVADAVLDEVRALWEQAALPQVKRALKPATKPATKPAAKPAAAATTNKSAGPRKAAARTVKRRASK